MTNAVNQETGELEEVLTPEEAALYAKLDAGIKKFTVQKNFLNAKIKRVYSKAGTYIIGKVIVVLQSRKSFDPVAFSKKYSQEKNPEYYTQVYVLNLEAVPEKLKSKFQTATLALSVSVADDK